MINKKRKEELENNFLKETTDEKSQEWRNILSNEEKQLINKWENEYNNYFNILNENIKYIKNKNVQTENKGVYIGEEIENGKVYFDEYNC